MKRPARALWLALATTACGGSNGNAKRVDAGADARPIDAPPRDSKGDLATDAPIVAADGAVVARDGRAAIDAGPLDVSTSVDVSWSVPDLSGACRVEITPILPASLVNLTAGPTAFLRVQGTVLWGDTAPFVPDWSWSVVRPDGQTVTGKADAGDPTQMQFPTSVAGRYDIAVDIGGCTGSARALVQDVTTQSRIYHLRALPPASAAQAVPYEVDIKIAAGSAPITKDIAFDTGANVTVDPTTGASTPLPVAVPSYVRIQSAGSTWVTYGRSSNDGPFRSVLDLMLEYQVLIVPDVPSDGSPALPPFLLDRTTSNNVKVDAQYIGAYGNPLPLPRGIAVSGHLWGPDGPAAGASISLRTYQSSTTAGETDQLFSTVGIADGEGSYTLRVNPAGTLSIVVTPPAGAPWPSATIEPGINLSDATVLLPDVDFHWQAVSTTALQIAVTRPDGGIPSSSVVVHLESATDPPMSVGFLSIGDGPVVDGGENDWPAPRGSVRRDASTDLYGNVLISDLPKGIYQITLIPAAAMPGLATTKYQVDTTQAADLLPIGLVLANKIAVAGRLLDAHDDATVDTGGATVVATDLGHDTMAAVTTAQVAADGSFVLALDPERTYSLAAQPIANRGLPSYVPLYGFSTGRSNMQLDEQRIPRGVLVQGHVSYAGTPIGQAVVQAFCVGLLPDCQDRTNLAAGSPPAYALSMSDGTGAYAFYLPDPATAP